MSERDWSPVGASSPPNMDTPPDADGFAPAGPRQPAAGVIWSPASWASYGAVGWKAGRCFVCGGPVRGFRGEVDHTACEPSYKAYVDGARAAGDPSPPPFPPRPSVDQYTFPRKGRNSTDSAESAENADSKLIDAVQAAGLVLRPLVNFPDMWTASAPNGKDIGDAMPGWRAAATAALMRLEADAKR